MRPELVRIEDVADLRTLSWAFWRAAQGKRGRPDVERMARRLESELAELSEGILAGNVVVGEARRFVIHDPKRRIIHAPVFRERVLHHALMHFVEVPLERALVTDSFACRVGKGSLAAARRAQEHVRRFPWLVKIDVRGYFDSIDHCILADLLARRIKGERVLALCRRIIDAYTTEPGKGLPIGALTSQHFANTYLATFDRFLLDECRVRGLVRYMDDVVWWCRDREECHATLSAARYFLRTTLALEIKTSVQVRPSKLSVTVCGFRIEEGRLGLGRRRRQRYARLRAAAERAYRGGLIDSEELQRQGMVALAITAHAEARGWRREQERRVPSPDA